MASFKFKRIFLLIFAGTVLLLSCRKAAVDPDSVPLKPVEPEPGKFTYTANVYACGYVIDTTKNLRQALYWKNGVANLLTTGNIYADATAIAVKDNEVYVAGVINEPKGSSVACYWKNGVLNKVQGDPKVSLATDIFISGNDVYLAGYIGDDAVYWKNGIKNTLSHSPENISAVALGISVSGSDVYASGYQFNTKTLAVATLWKNGVPTTLAANGPSATNIFINNNDVYVAANYGFLSNHPTFVNYWKNGVPVILPKTIPIQTGSVAVEDENIYISGNVDSGPAYYKNDKLTTIDEKTGRIATLTVLKGDVYVAGNVMYQNNRTAAFWKNGQMVRLVSTVGKVSSISDVVVTPF